MQKQRLAFETLTPRWLMAPYDLLNLLQPEDPYSYTYTHTQIAAK